ncbi:hypothetical protein DENSPDRAFT_886536 [Dentipellis sp. KUC8613]|nr:hypothetical protein DENSPDRAFT_886536 [Dentipellis sp. KUC8613]
MPRWTVCNPRHRLRAQLGGLRLMPPSTRPASPFQHPAPPSLGPVGPSCAPWGHSAPYSAVCTLRHALSTPHQALLTPSAAVLCPTSPSCDPHLVLSTPHHGSVSTLRRAFLRPPPRSASPAAPSVCPASPSLHPAAQSAPHPAFFGPHGAVLRPLPRPYRRLCPPPRPLDAPHHRLRAPWVRLRANVGCLVPTQCPAPLPPSPPLWLWPTPWCAVTPPLRAIALTLPPWRVLTRPSDAVSWAVAPCRTRTHSLMSRPPLVPPSWAPSWCRPMLPRVAVAAPRSHLPSLLHHAPWLHRAPIPPQRGILRPRTPPPTTRVSVPCFRRRPTHARCLLAYASRPHPAVPREHADIMRTRGRRFVSVRCRLKPPLSSPRSCCFMPVCHDLPTPPHLCFLALSRIPAAVLTCTSLSRPLVFALPRALAAVCPPLHFSSRAPFTHTRALHTPSSPSTPRRRSPHLIFIGRNQQERTDYASPVSRARAPRAVCSSDPAAAVCPPHHAPVAPQHCAALLLYHFAPQQQHRTPAAASRPHHVPATLSAAPLTSRHFVHTLAVLRAPEMTQEVPLRTLPPSNGVWRRPHTPLCHIACPDAAPTPPRTPQQRHRKGVSRCPTP